MNDQLKACSRQVIDGQELSFCPHKKWLKFLEQGEVDGTPIPDYYRKRIKKLELPLSLKYTDLRLALVVDRVDDRSRFMFYTVVDIKGDMQRVGIAGTRCENCNWSGWIGNPNVSDIYFDISKDFKSFELMRRARAFERKPCPSCGIKLSQDAIWVGDLL